MECTFIETSNLVFRNNEKRRKLRKFLQEQTPKDNVSFIIWLCFRFINSILFLSSIHLSFHIIISFKWFSRSFNRLSKIENSPNVMYGRKSFVSLPKLLWVSNILFPIIDYHYNCEVAYMSDCVSRFRKDIPPNLILAAWLALLVPPSPPPKPKIV